MDGELPEFDYDRGDGISVCGARLGQQMPAEGAVPSCARKGDELDSRVNKY